MTKLTNLTELAAAPLLRLSRRQVLQAVALAPLAASAATASRFDAEDPRSLLRAFRALRYSLTEEPVYWWMRVSKHGLIDGRLTHLYDMEIATLFRARDRGDETFSVTSLELIYSIDPVTGELLDTLRNPYTGETLPWNHTPVGPASVEYSLQGLELPGSLPGVRIQMEHSLTSGMVQDGRVWLKDDNSAVVTQESGDDPPFLVTDWSTYLGSVADLENPALLTLPCTVSFQSTTSWQKPMRMGRRPGSMISRGAGAKVERYAQLPGRVRAYIEQLHPEIARDPAAALDRNPYRFEK